jgi:hypothetical protein
LNDLPNLKACQIFFMNEIIQEITRQKWKILARKPKNTSQNMEDTSLW